MTAHPSWYAGVEQSLMQRSRSLPLVLVTLMLMGFIPLAIAGSAPMNGGPYEVNSNETWSVDGQFDAQVTIIAGATLTIKSDLEVVAGASITVEEGGTLRVEDSTLTAENGPHAVRPIALEASLMAYSSVAPGGFELRIIAAPDTVLDNWTVRWDDIPAQDMNGSAHEINFTAPRDDFRITFELPPGRIGNLVIDSIEIDDDNGPTTNTQAIDAEPINFLLAGDPGFPITIHGTAHFENSVITGAVIDIDGAVTTADTAFKASGPVLVTGEGASLSMLGGSVTMSRVDHDVELDAFASIQWGAATGSGGDIDRWERIVPEQTIHIPINGMKCTNDACVRYTYHGVGGEGNLLDRTVDHAGNSKVPARTVEIGWADTTEVWTESATIEVTLFRTAWNLNPELDSWSEGVLVPLPYDVEHIDIIEFLDHPIIAIDSVILDSDEATVGRSTTVEISVTNDGTEAATLFISCNIGGTNTSADTSPKFAPITLAGGESDSTEVKWTYHKEAEVGLDCYIVEPYQFLELQPFISNRIANATLEGSSDAATFEWTSSSSDGDFMLIMVGVLIITIIIGMVYVVRLAQAGSFGEPSAEEVVEELEREDDEGDFDEDDGDETVTGATDRFAEMMAEEESD